MPLEELIDLILYADEETIEKVEQILAESESQTGYQPES